MNPVDNQFDNLRRLLALKRHECPPPGHFDHLADRIRAALESGRGEPRPGFWTQLAAQFDFRPAFASALALVVGTAFYYGWSSSHAPEAALPALATAPSWMPPLKASWPSPATEPDPPNQLLPAVLSSSVYPVVDVGAARAWFQNAPAARADHPELIKYTVPSR
jgi:hypothetical protein